MRDVLAALRFFTILPLGRGEFEPGNMAAVFPIAGMIVGLLTAGFDLLAMRLWPGPAAAVLDVVFLAVISGDDSMTLPLMAVGGVGVKLSPAKVIARYVWVSLRRSLTGWSSRTVRGNAADVAASVKRRTISGTVNSRTIRLLFRELRPAARSVTLPSPVRLRTANGVKSVNCASTTAFSVGCASWYQVKNFALPMLP